MILGERILVTGGSGFVGRHLTRHLAEQGATVHWMSSRNHGVNSGLEKRVLNTFRSPEEVVGIVKAIQPSLVFHLATHFVGVHSPTDLDRLVDANITFGCAVAEGSALSRSRFVNVESAWQRFEGRSSSVSLYAALKNAFEDVLSFYHEVHGLAPIRVFLFDTYGPSDGRGKIVTKLLDALSSGETVNLGSADKLINLTHVSDVVRGLMIASVKSSLEDWVIKPNATISLAELVEEVEDASGRALDVRWDPSLDRPREMRTDWSFGSPLRIENALSLRAGLQMELNRERA